MVMSSILRLLARSSLLVPIIAIERPRPRYAYVLDKGKERRCCSVSASTLTGQRCLLVLTYRTKRTGSTCASSHTMRYAKVKGGSRPCLYLLSLFASALTSVHVQCYYSRSGECAHQIFSTAKPTALAQSLCNQHEHPPFKQQTGHFRTIAWPLTCAERSAHSSISVPQLTCRRTLLRHRQQRRGRNSGTVQK